MKPGKMRVGIGKSTSRRLGNRRTASSMRARTSGSHSSNQAMPTATSSSATWAGAKPGARISIIAVHSATVRAMGPAWSQLGARGKQPSSETSAYVGLKPTIPQQAAGMRIEPPESVPSAASARPAASAAAEPPLEPPAIRPSRSGFGTVPKCGFSEVTP